MFPDAGLDLEAGFRIPQQLVDRKLGGLLDLGSSLVESRNAAGKHERLSLRATLREPALHQQDVEPLFHPGKGTYASDGRQRSEMDRDYDVRALRLATISARTDVSASSSASLACACPAAVSAS